MSIAKVAKLGIIASVIALIVPAVASAGHPVHKLAPSYQAAYCYPTGTYWSKQISSFPDYYNKYNDYYQATYGAASAYCPS